MLHQNISLSTESPQIRRGAIRLRTRSAVLVWNTRAALHLLISVQQALRRSLGASEVDHVSRVIGSLNCTCAFEHLCAADDQQMNRVRALRAQEPISHLGYALVSNERYQEDFGI